MESLYEKLKQKGCYTLLAKGRELVTSTPVEDVLLDFKRQSALGGGEIFVLTLSKRSISTNSRYVSQQLRHISTKDLPLLVQIGEILDEGTKYLTLCFPRY